MLQNIPTVKPRVKPRVKLHYFTSLRILPANSYCHVTPSILFTHICLVVVLEIQQDRCPQEGKEGDDETTSVRASRAFHNLVTGIVDDWEVG